MRPETAASATKKPTTILKEIFPLLKSVRGRTIKTIEGKSDY
jgi:hypothetical protein